ncbi:hypothetical protein [Jannaschia sp. R86511]|uniref:hypothetical protein n=1 Tax=Jannaschia sp. R86511 TaxID=3093853 RepID=UPI0036D3CE17
MSPTAPSPESRRRGGSDRSGSDPGGRTAPVVPTGLVAAGSLVTGFAVAQATDVRALGGLVLLAGAAWCGRQWWRQGPPTAVGLLAGYAGAFVGSHALAREVGAWPAVLSVSAAVAAASWVAADRHRR